MSTNTMTDLGFGAARLRSTVRTISLHLVVAALASSAAVTLLAGQVAGQSTTSAVAKPPRVGNSTRAELVAQAALAESISTSSTNADIKRRKLVEAALIRDRLREGDFSIGDRIVVEVLGGEKAVYDSLTVRGGRIIYLADMPPISLQGVLRSEIEEYITAQVGKYIRNPQVSAMSLVQVIFSGKANKIGFAWLPTDILLSDAIMQGGGPGSGSDILKTVVKRGNKELWPKEQVREALREGMTLDQLNIRAGDEIVIGTAPPPRDWRQNLFVVTSLLTLIYGIKRVVP